MPNKIKNRISMSKWNKQISKNNRKNKSNINQKKKINNRKINKKRNRIESKKVILLIITNQK